MGQAAPPQRRERRPAITAAVLHAFQAGDEDFFRRLLKLEIWEFGPIRVAGWKLCTQRHPIDRPVVDGYGCRGQHLSHALYRRIAAELERRRRRV